MMTVVNSYMNLSIYYYCYTHKIPYPFNRNNINNITPNFSLCLNHKSGQLLFFHFSFSIHIYYNNICINNTQVVFTLHHFLGFGVVRMTLTPSSLAPTSPPLAWGPRGLRWSPVGMCRVYHPRHARLVMRITYAKSAKLDTAEVSWELKLLVKYAKTEDFEFSYYF